ncbi:MAG: hypothetical protein WAO58_04080 [Fimbriimonadaceae bacterium]
MGNEPFTWDEDGNRVPLDRIQSERLKESGEGAGTSNQQEPIYMTGMSRRDRKRLLKHYSPRRNLDPFFLEKMGDETNAPIAWLVMWGFVIGLVSLAWWIVGLFR